MVIIKHHTTIPTPSMITNATIRGWGDIVIIKNNSNNNIYKETVKEKRGIT